jgi:hypothetical protein
MAKFKTKHKELSKDELEREKLISEIRVLNRPFWKESSFIIAIMLALIGWLSGIFEASKKLIEIKTKELEKQRDSLVIEISKLSDDYITIKYNYDSIQGKFDTLSYEFEKSKKTEYTLKINNDSLKIELDIWKLLKQSKPDLQKEVLGFVREIRFLISEYTPSLDNTHVVCRIYDHNYRQNALLYRQKLEYLLYGTNSTGNFEKSSYYMEVRATIRSMRFVADDLEAMANMIRD